MQIAGIESQSAVESANIWQKMEGSHPGVNPWANAHRAVNLAPSPLEVVVAPDRNLWGLAWKVHSGHPRGLQQCDLVDKYLGLSSHVCHLSGSTPEYPPSSPRGRGMRGIYHGWVFAPTQTYRYIHHIDGCPTPEALGYQALLSDA